MVKYTCYGMLDDKVEGILSTYRIGDLSEIIESIDFHKGLFTFTFKVPNGYKSWKQWLLLNKMYKEMSRFITMLHNADNYDLEHNIEDQYGKVVIYVNKEGVSYP